MNESVLQTAVLKTFLGDNRLRVPHSLRYATVILPLILQDFHDESAYTVTFKDKF